MATHLAKMRRWKRWHIIKPQFGNDRLTDYAECSIGAQWEQTATLEEGKERNLPICGNCLRSSTLEE